MKKPKLNAVLNDIIEYYPELSNVDTHTLKRSTAEAITQTDGRIWGDYKADAEEFDYSIRAQAIYNYSAHLCNMPSGGQRANLITNQSKGGVSVGFSILSPQNSTQELLASTSYGQKFLSLRDQLTYVPSL